MHDKAYSQEVICSSKWENDTIRPLDETNGCIHDHVQTRLTFYQFWFGHLIQLRESRKINSFQIRMIQFMSLIQQISKKISITKEIISNISLLLKLSMKNHLCSIIITIISVLLNSVCKIFYYVFTNLHGYYYMGHGIFSYLLGC